MISFSEIETTVKRASRAVGFSWGLSEEVGKSVCLLEMYGLPGLKNINHYYKSLKNKKYQNPTYITKLNTSKIPYCPIISGVNFLDQVISLEELSEIKFENFAYPILFLPFLSRSSEIIGKKIHLKIDQKEFLLNFNQSIYSNIMSVGIIENANKVNILFAENKNTFEENEWNELYKLSEKTFVEETEELKEKTAGAGLLDND